MDARLGPAIVESFMLHVSELTQIAMMGTSECLAHATEMDRRASECNGGARASFLAIAKGWRRVARMALYQDGWSTPKKDDQGRAGLLPLIFNPL